MASLLQFTMDHSASSCECTDVDAEQCAADRGCTPTCSCECHQMHTVLGGVQEEKERGGR